MSRSLVITVYPMTLTEEEKVKLAVKEKLDSAFADGENETITLPAEVDGKRVRAYFPKEE